MTFEESNREIGRSKKGGCSINTNDFMNPTPSFTMCQFMSERWEFLTGLSSSGLCVPGFPFFQTVLSKKSQWTWKNL